MQTKHTLLVLIMLQNNFGLLNHVIQIILNTYSLRFSDGGYPAFLSRDNIALNSVHIP